jgi:hypothetical protein
MHISNKDITNQLVLFACPIGKNTDFLKPVQCQDFHVQEQAESQGAGSARSTNLEVPPTDLAREV